jgi:signal transduction histidine kinase/FixJ family two-component response regulator
METSLIYVVDDEPGIALLCKRLLVKAGYKVETQTDPRVAIDYLKESKIDLLLVDIRMPEVDGFEVIQHAQRLQPDASILIMTGHGTVETAIRALRQGVDGLILKPFGQGSELIDAVELAFADSQQKKDAARTNALRPLFSVTESLLSETRREPLLELIIKAISGHLQCSHAACYQQNESGEFALLNSRGSVPSQEHLDLISRAESSSAPMMINATGPGAPALKLLFANMGIGAAILVPILRPNMHMLLYAAREPKEQPFQESDFEMFQILARQAAVALENSRLYAEQLAYVRKIEESQKALLQAEKMATAGRLSASIAHEINNPLQSVQNCLHLAGREDFPADKRKEYFLLAQTELERLANTTRRMLDFYRPGATSLEKVDIADILKYILNLMAKQLKEVNVTVIVDFVGTIPPIMAVSSQLQQVFINLILNAADAMSEKGGVLRITAATLKDGVEIIFHDNGDGVPKEAQSNIFEPFFSTKEGGTGLGLTVSYNIITANGGTLELLPERAPGACFRIFMPLGGKQ